MAHLTFHNGAVAVTYDANTYVVGRVKQDTLYLDSPSKHKSSHSYGIDKCVLLGSEMGYVYKYIILIIGRQEYVTSRQFWLDHGKEYDLQNGRGELFLPLGLFGADKALLYERYLQVKELAEKDIFDVAQDSGGSWDSINRWEDAIKLKEEYLSSLKFKVQL